MRFSSLFTKTTILLGSVSSVSGFIGNFFQTTAAVIRPDLLQITDRQEDKKLNFKLYIGSLDDGQMLVSNMVVELHHDLATYEHVELPGADGQHKHLSSGHRSLNVLSQGNYIDFTGTHPVATEKGCWEMCWRKGKPAGTFVCGFELPETYTRNAATIPKGLVYLSFPLWTEEGLKIGQEEKRKVEELCQQYLMEREEALYYHEITTNPIMKAIHLQNANAAEEKYDALPHDTLDTIPDNDGVVLLQDDLLLTTKGMIFSKTVIPGGQGGHTYLGVATVSIDNNNNNKFKKLMP